jgi:ATP-dependent Lon protease
MSESNPKIHDEEEQHPTPDKRRFGGFEEDLSDIEIPDLLPVLPLRGVVVFPAAIAPLLISRQSSLKAVEHAVEHKRLIALLAQQNPEDEQPTVDKLHRRGTAARVLKLLRYPDGSVRILVQGIRRIEVSEFVQEEPFLEARAAELADTNTAGIEAPRTHLTAQFSKFVSLNPHLPDELQMVVMNIEEPGKVADLVASNLNIHLAEKQELLAIVDVGERIERLTGILNREIELLELGNKIHSDVQSELTRNQREFYLRQQLRAIQKELGEGDSRTAEIDELIAKMEKAQLPEKARKAAEHEIDRLRMIPPESAEHSVVRTYIEWLVNLPWAVSTEDNLDIAHARAVLDEDHYDLEKIKERILEFLAVRRLKNDSRGPILCFVGPPGTGKTSLGRSIARAMGRKFVRMSLGGMRDEAEIRGHRRTYIGSLPGRIVQNLRNAESNNPLFVLDEIDKLGSDFRGDPASAMLEVLDPEQNNSFQDHYLDVPFDLSKVMFVTTANVLDTIPPPLRDRMEVIELAGYTEEDKIEIARRHVIPKQIAENGLTDANIHFAEDGIVHVIRHYTREAGLRNLEREIGSLCRKVARNVTEGNVEPVTIDAARVREMLGAERYFSEVAERTGEPGVAVGLAWTPMGGDIMFIEATKMAGKKGLTLTGHLGDVMKESAQAALSWIRSRAGQLGIAPDFFDNTDLHVHVPAGAVPKDGPSAGITLAVALTSLLTNRAVRHDLAMTGEITLRGKVLPVGGIKEKVLGARRAGIDTVILPKRNEKDLEDIPPHIRSEMRFLFVEKMEEVLAHALVADARVADVDAPVIRQAVGLA